MHQKLSRVSTVARIVGLAMLAVGVVVLIDGAGALNLSCMHQDALATRCTQASPLSAVGLLALLCGGTVLAVVAYYRTR
jgi:hypothetical protein